ncbi:MAG: hypothetical protein [Wendovervirus sonii]|uniref:Uncharacterized protein n=1 Tax=phage Lak_Megaphage_Sonny TaxID=3109229 RepID=A0ABZ0Z6J5_9CAUD|nr:MAG: hypothetical protein [phage Lak_Megaphage_Sonny]
MKENVRNYNLSECPDFQTLKSDLENRKVNFGYVAYSLGMSSTKLRQIVEFENGNFTIEYLKNNWKDIREKHIDEIKQKKHAINENKKAKRKISDDESYFDDYDDYRYKSFNSAKQDAIWKNQMLVGDYEMFKKYMCNGLGQRKIKFFLNKKSKEGDKIAYLYRTALEIENTNINAKKYRNTSRVHYKDNLYEQKEELLKELIKLCDEFNNENEDKIIFGYQPTCNYSTNMLLYFELPSMEQISFHCNLTRKEMGENISEYTKKWDGKENSTLEKIEDAINERYSEELEKMKGKKK